MREGGLEMNNMLKKMWKRQQRQQVELGLDPNTLSEIDKRRVAKDMALGLYEEVKELIDSTVHYKAHILKNTPTEKTNIIEDTADVLKYLFAMAQLYDVTAEELFQGFVEKTRVVDDIAHGQKLELERNTKLIISDLDGCIADISELTNELSNAQGNKSMDDKMVDSLERMKTHFYIGGGFKKVPAIHGAMTAMHWMKEMGYKIVIITARPYWQYKRIYSDTLEWCRNNGIVYDSILFNKDKAEAIYEHIFPARPMAFIEDRDKHALELAGIGVRVLLLDRPYNQSLPEHPLIKRVRDWREIIKYLEKWDEETEEGLAEVS